MSETWISCRDQLPPEGADVLTKIHDAKGCRNEQRLKRRGRLWFFPDMSMYVYYEPTHWLEEKGVCNMIHHGIDYYDKHHPEGNYIAWRSTNFGDAYRGRTAAEAVAKLRKAHPETASWPDELPKPKA